MKLRQFNIDFGSSLFKALSDPARIRILHLLLHKESLCVSDIENVLDFTQRRTSRHISYLKNTGLIKQYKQDQWIIYQVKDELIDILTQIFDLLQKDQQLNQDSETYDILFSNRELSASRYLK